MKLVVVEIFLGLLLLMAAFAGREKPTFIRGSGGMVSFVEYIDPYEPVRLVPLCSGVVLLAFGVIRGWEKNRVSTLSRRFESSAKDAVQPSTLPVEHCATHVGEPAVAKCQLCGRLLCNDCRVCHQDRSLCAECLDGLTPIQTSQSRVKRGLVIILAVAAFGCLAEGYRSRWGEATLGEAIENNDMRTFSIILLLRPGLARKTDPFSWLRATAEFGNPDMVRHLLELGADPDGGDSCGMRPMHSAGNAEIASILLARGANPNLRDNYYDQNALHWAVACGREDVVKVLLDHGMDVKEKTAKEKTVFDLAKDRGQSMIDLLRSHQETPPPQP